LASSDSDNNILASSLVSVDLSLRGQRRDTMETVSQFAHSVYEVEM